ncbi:MAG: hydantoinase B/oxoprolinase family protein [Rhodobacteraceae bacterium]|jgi:N-methylhydantoinase B|nr:hydantoinase B/oxoprolinase family protein [Paracoccaceae bacterium]
MRSEVARRAQADGLEDIDPVSFEVIRNALLNITEEMAVTIRRAAYSTNIKTRADFSCAFFDATPLCVAQSFAQPAHLVSMSSIVPAVIREIGPENMQSGDVFLINDAHRGTSHLNDITAITPIDVQGRRIGYFANMAHHVDVGGSAPASLGVSREIFQEGLIIPPTLIARGDRIDHNVLNLLLSNVRAPRETRGDLRAQMSANVIGLRRVTSLVERYGADFLEKFFAELLRYTERWTEREIRRLPEGIYEAEGFRDDNGMDDEPVRLRARVTIRDGHIHLDVTGSSPQRAGPLNCTRPMARCAIAFVSRCLIDNRLPVNDGFLSRIHIDGPDGLCCTAQRPMAVVGGWELAARLTDVVFKALHPALPKRIPACGKGLIVNLGFGGHDPLRNEYFCYMETIAGGNGARPGKDGPDAVQVNLQNTENAPIEEVELNYPILVRRYELIVDSCGAGQFRGGLGVRRDFEFPHAPVTCTILSDGCKFAPWGLDGGDSGAPARFVYDPEGEGRVLRSKCTVDVPTGGRIRIETPGGGGIGNPTLRRPESLARDLEDGKVTEEWARAARSGSGAAGSAPGVAAATGGAE